MRLMTDPVFPPSKSTTTISIMGLAMFSHSISCYLFQAIVPTQLVTKFNLDENALKSITDLFSITQFVFLLLGASLYNIIVDRLLTIYLLIITCLVVQVMFYTSGVLFLGKLAIFTMAAASSTLKIALFDYGAREYYYKSCSDLYRYYLVVYVAEIVGHLVALLFIPLDMLLKNECSSYMSCMAYVACISGIFEAVTGILFSNCAKSNSEYPRHGILMNIRTMCRFLLIFLPCFVILVAHEMIFQTLFTITKLLDCMVFWHNFNTDYMLLLDLFAIIVCGIIYICITCFKLKYLVTYPICTIALGGFIMAIGTILLSNLNQEAGGYTIRKPHSNYSQLFILESDEGIYLRIENYMLLPDEATSNSGFHRAHFLLSTSKSCKSLLIAWITYATRVDKFSTEICFEQQETYLLNIKCLYDGLIFYCRPTVNYVDMRRGLLNYPKLCVTPVYDLHRLNYNVVVQSLNSTTKYVFMSSDGFSCRIIRPGFYLISSNFKAVKNIFFQYGGVYLMTVSLHDDQPLLQIAELQPPLRIPIWYLIVILFTINCGKILMIIPTFYIAYTQSEENIRLIVIGWWWIYISSGLLISSISNRKAFNLGNNNRIYRTGILIWLMTILFLVLSRCLGKWNFSCDQQAQMDNESSVLRNIETTQEAASTMERTLSKGPILKYGTRKKYHLINIRIKPNSSKVHWNW